MIFSDINIVRYLISFIGGMQKIKKIDSKL